MSIRIKKLYIKNFKVYTEKVFDFNNTPLVVFDGSNGFGKTTIFDAIELVFTGGIRRYKVIESILDRREARMENPLYNTNGDGFPIILKLQFEYNGENYIIARKTKAKNELNTKLDFSDFKLYTIDDFGEEPLEENIKEEDYITQFLGDNYKSDFEFLNYIEQEDSLYLLKASEKDKRNSISYLFNTGDFENKIEKFSTIVNILKKHNENFDKKIYEVNEEIKVLTKEVIDEKEVPYHALFKNTDYNWDAEKIDFNKISYSSLLDTELGLLIKLENLVKHKKIFNDSLYNAKLNTVLRNKDAIRRLYYYDYFIPQEERILEEKEIIETVTELRIQLRQFTFENLLEAKYDIKGIVKKEFNSEKTIGNYEQKLEELKKIYRNSDSTSKIYINLLSSRDILKIHLINFHNTVKETGICPLCGNNWEEAESLLQEIENQKIELEAINKTINSNLNDLKNSFIKNEAKELIIFLISSFSNFTYNIEYFQDDFFEEELKRENIELKEALKQLHIKYSNYTSEENSLGVNDKQDINKLFVYLKNQLKEYDDSLIKSYFKDIFNIYFEANTNNLEQFEIDKISTKKNYVKYRYSIYLNESLKAKGEIITKTVSLKSKCEESLAKIKTIIDSLRDTLKWYNDQLIKDIELLFHIYSGRIVQDFYGGLGLFIINKNNKIKFVTNPDKTYDAVFSMSNGQLSALIISFTLALNKKYSSSKLLLIDDPVQSMDDMNTAGFVEVLRNDFNDAQIFLSTHEQAMSTYVRYKFKKFNLDSQRINLRDDDSLQEL